jgi:hypothetical protein
VRRSTASRKHLVVTDPLTGAGLLSHARSIPVADLIGRQQLPAIVPVREKAAADRPSGGASVPADPPAQDIPPSKAAKVARFAGYTAGALALCGYVAAASLITGRMPSIGAVAPSAQPSAITGATALRPDLLGAQLGAPVDSPVTPTTTSDETPVSSVPPTARPSGEQQDTSNVGTPQATAQATPFATPQSDSQRPVNPSTAEPSTASPSAAGPDDNAEVVRQFYRLIRSQPAAAFGLIDPVLRGSDSSGFVSSWSAVRAVNVERVESRPDKSILAVVSLQRSDGRWLVVQQLLRTTDTTPLRIAGVEILSAQLG